MNIDLKIADATSILTDLFEGHKQEIFASSPDFINELRIEAMDSFNRLKLPKRNDENYKYTWLTDHFNKEFAYSFHPEGIEFEMDDIFKCDVPELDTEVILVLNGFFFNPYKALTRLPNGIVYGSLSAASREYPELFRKHFSRYAGFENNSVVALNTALSQDGVFLYVPQDRICEKTLQIIHLSLSEQPRMINHRNLFILEEHAQANILICDHTLSPHHFLTNSVTEIFAGSNSVFDITRVQNEHNDAVQVTNTHIRQMGHSRMSSNYITLHGGLVRNNLNVQLDGMYSDNQSAGLFLADRTQHIDNFVTINHNQPDCTSNQLYKGILDDHSTGAFTGRINVARDAQKTAAYQKNNNLLLTNTAKMHTRPQLEIYADDVKCSHGATVGQLNYDALFYLRSRGIPEHESRHLLMSAFAIEVLSLIKIPALKERITDLVEKRLRGELSRCNNCKMKCR